MKLEVVLMTMLRVHPRTGYDIKRWIDREGKFEGLDRGSSQVYRTLTKLERRGAVTFQVEERPGVPSAKVYRLTPAGGAQLDSYLRAPYAPTALLDSDEFLWRMRGLASEDTSAALRIAETELQARRRQVRENRNRDREFGPEARADGSTDAGVLFNTWFDQRGMDNIDRLIVELEDLVARLREVQADQHRRHGMRTTEALA